MFECLQKTYRENALPLFLLHPSVDANGWEIAFHQQLVQLLCSANGLDEDDDLQIARAQKRGIRLNPI